MKYIKRVIILSLFASIFFGAILSSYAFPGYRVIYKEQYYNLYRQHLYMYPENYAENIRWLENALRADFANPLNALARIETKKEWEWYRNHFYLHVNLLLTRSYLQWAKGYIKEHAYFYNEPWKEQNLKSLEKAKKLIDMAIVYWDETLRNVAQIQAMNEHFMNLEEIQYWEDEYYRIKTGELNYEKIIGRELANIERVSAEFEAMDENTY